MCLSLSGSRSTTLSSVVCLILESLLWVLFHCWDTDHYVPSRNQVIKTSFYRQTDTAASHYLAQKYLCKVTKWKISIWHQSLHKVASFKIAMNSMHYVSVSNMISRLQLWPCQSEVWTNKLAFIFKWTLTPSSTELEVLDIS